MLAIAKNVAHGPFVFGREKRHEPLVFKQKLCSKHVFLYKTEGLNDNFISKEKAGGHGPNANQPGARPCQPPWS